MRCMWHAACALHHATARWEEGMLSVWGVARAGDSSPLPTHASPCLALVRQLRFVKLDTGMRPSRRRTSHDTDSSGAAWQTDDGPRLYHDEAGRVYKVRSSQRAASSAV